jgi:hypothetical protein
MLRENLTGERIVIEVYTETIRWLGEAEVMPLASEAHRR